MAPDVASISATTGQANGLATHTATPLLGARRPTIAEQLAEVGVVEHVNIGNVNSLPHLVYGHRRFVLEEWVHEKKTRSSLVHRYGCMVLEIAGNAVQGTYWICTLCNLKQLFLAPDARRQTSSIWSHLETVHSNRKDNKRVLEEDSCQTRLDGRVNQTEKPLPQAWADEFFRLILAWIVATGGPFRSIDDDNFMNILVHLNKPAVTRLLSSSGNTITAWITDRFSNARCDVSKLLVGAPSKIHLSWDLWTSPYDAAMLAVCCHFIDGSLTRRHLLLALRPTRGDHTALDQATAIWAVAVEYRIQAKLGIFIFDNAATKDTTACHILSLQMPETSEAMPTHQAEAQRLQCIGHIFNLVARAFMDGNDVTAIMADPNDEDDLESDQRILDAWRKKGPIGKLHNTVKYIRQSSRRREAFERCAQEQGADAHALGVELLDDKWGPVRLTTNNAARWNSTFKMIKRGLGLRPEVEAYYAHAELVDMIGVPGNDRLTSDDWNVLKDMMAILKPLYILTHRMQGCSAILSDVIPSLDLLVDHFSEQLRALAEPLLPEPLDDGQQRSLRESLLPRDHQGFVIHAQLPHPSPRSVAEPEPVGNPVQDPRLHVRQSIQNALDKVVEYRSIIEEIPIYWVTLILHPRYNLCYISSNYSNEIMGRALDSMRHIYRDYQTCHQQNLAVQRSPPAAPLGPGRIHSGPEVDLFERYIQRQMGKSAAQQPVDELDAYLSMEQVKPNDVIAWWRRQAKIYPVLSRIALDVLSIPPMSDECERVFSQAKETVPGNRSSISPATLEALQCLGNWKKHGIV